MQQVNKHWQLRLFGRVNILLYQCLYSKTLVCNAQDEDGLNHKANIKSVNNKKMDKY